MIIPERLANVEVYGSAVNENSRMIGPRFPGGAREAFVHPELIHTVLRMSSAPCHAPVPGVVSAAGCRRQGSLKEGT